MSDGIYQTVPVVPGWSACTGGSKAQPIPSKKAVDAYVSTQATLRQRPPLAAPRSSNSESEISCSPKHASGVSFSKLAEAYASVYDCRSNIVSGEGSKKMEPLPLGTSSTIPEHFQEYVTMKPVGEPGTPEGVALANLLRRINQLEESRKENERITQEVPLSLCLHTRQNSAYNVVVRCIGVLAVRDCSSAIMLAG